MTKIEIGLVIIICLLPIIALVMILPKKLFSKKGKKPEPKPEQPQEAPAPAKEEPKPVEVKEEEPSKELEEYTDLYQEEDFKAYLKDRAEKHPSPKEKDGDPTQFGKFDPDLFGPVNKTPPPPKKQPKTLQEEIEGLSPELKALLLSGALNPKHFDKDDK